MPWNARDTSKASNPKYKRFLAYTDPGPGKGSCLFATNRVLKKHEIAHVTAQLQAQVKLLLSRKHNNEMFSELQMRGQVICDDCCEVELIYCCCLSHVISARSQQSKFANFQPPPTPHPAPQHCRTASRRHRHWQYQVTHRRAYSRSNNVAMSRVRILESIISSNVGLAPSRNVCTRSSEE